MTKSGMGLGLALLMSLTVYAGSSQLATLPLLSTGAPLWLIWFTAFLVNVRFVIYSAQWRWYFGDLPRWQRAMVGYFAADTNYVQFLRAWPDPHPAPGQLPYFAGSVVALWLSWQVPSWSGIVLADEISPAWGLGFAGTLSLVGLTCALLIDRISWVCAAVAALAAVAAFSLPYKLNIVVAVASALAAGLWMEGWGGRGASPTAPGRAP